MRFQPTPSADIEAKFNGIETGVNIPQKLQPEEPRDPKPAFGLKQDMSQDVIFQRELDCLPFQFNHYMRDSKKMFGIIYAKQEVFSMSKTWDFVTSCTI